MQSPVTRNGRLGKFIPMQDRDKLARDMTLSLENRKNSAQSHRHRARANLAGNMNQSPRLTINPHVLVAALRNRNGSTFALMQLIRRGLALMRCSPAPRFGIPAQNPQQVFRHFGLYVARSTSS